MVKLSLKEKVRNDCINKEKKSLQEYQPKIKSKNNKKRREGLRNVT